MEPYDEIMVNKFFLTCKMDNVLNIMSQVVVDIQGFNETHFGIFPDEDQKYLLDLWNNKVDKNPNSFVSLVSPKHKELIAKWAIDRTSFNIQDLIIILQNFINFLKNIKHSFLTINASGKVTPRKLKGWQKILYTQSKRRYK